jgi:hypothetical protein
MVLVRQVVQVMIVSDSGDRLGQCRLTKIVNLARLLLIICFKSQYSQVV